MRLGALDRRDMQTMASGGIDRTSAFHERWRDAHSDKVYALRHIGSGDLIDNTDSPDRRSTRVCGGVPAPRRRPQTDQ
jgi:hypothetical protein